MVFDDWFETVYATVEKEPPEWKELIQFQTMSNDLDDDQYIPELPKEWLNAEELKQRANQDKQECEKGQSELPMAPTQPEGTEELLIQREQTNQEEPIELPISPPSLREQPVDSSQREPLTPSEPEQPRRSK